MTTRKNLCPNPGLKNDATGWTGNGAWARVTGVTGMPRTTGNGYTAGTFAQTPTGTPATAGQQYTGSFYIKETGGLGTAAATLYLAFTRSSGGDDFSNTVAIGAIATNTPTRINITATAPANATGCYLLYDGNNFVVRPCTITAVLLEQAAALDSYFDGDTTFAVWDGADGNSTSTLTISSDVSVPDPVASGGSTAGQDDGTTRGDGSSGGVTAGTPDGMSLGDGSGGGSTGGQLDGRALGDSSGGGGTGGTTDGRVIGDGSGGAGTGGQADTLIGDITVPDPLQRGAGTGGTPDTVTIGTQVVHDQMVMPLALKARTCMVAEVAKLANPPAKVQIRPGATFTAMADSIQDECCGGIAYVRPGLQVPTSGNWPSPLNGVDGPSASRGRAPYFAVTLELGIYHCVPIIANDGSGDDAFPTEAEWLQATVDQLDAAAALRRVVCCLQVEYGVDSVLAGPVQPLESSGNCGGIIMSVQLRAPACDCVG